LNFDLIILLFGLVLVAAPRTPWNGFD
jgi:hypothetical protein